MGGNMAISGESRFSINASVTTAGDTARVAIIESAETNTAAAPAVAVAVARTAAEAEVGAIHALQQQQQHG